MASTDHILTVLWRRRLSVVLTFMLTLGAVVAATYALPTVYSTTAYLWITPSEQTASDFEAAQVSQTLTTTYAELLQTPGVADAVAAELPFESTGLALRDAVEVAPVPESQLLEITAEDGSPERAQDIANTYAEVFSEREREVSGAAAADSRVTVAEEAPLPVVPTRPQPMLYIAAGALFALFMGGAVGLLRHRLDQRLELGDGTREVLDMPVLGRIPKGSRALLRQFVRAEARPTAKAGGVDEAFRMALANLIFANNGARPRTIAVVSASGGEGKSTCSLGIGRAGRETGLEVLLVDGDLRRATLSRSLDIGPTARAGFSGFLVNPRPLGETTSQVPGHLIEIVPAGPQPPNASALLSSPRLEEFDRLAHSAYDLVVYDTPPLSVGADASLLATVAEGVVLVIDASSTKRSAALQAVDQLTRARAKVLGVVINRTGRPADYYYYADVPDGRAVGGNGRSPQLPPVQRTEQLTRDRE